MRSAVQAAVTDGAEVRFGQVGDFWLSTRDDSDVWCRTWYDPAKRQTRRASLGTADVQEAYQALIKFVAGNPSAKEQPAETVTVHQVLNWFYENRGKKLSSASAFRNSFGHWQGYFNATVTVREATPLKITAFREALEAEGYAPGYVIRILSDGRTAFNWCLDNQLIDWVPRIKSGQNAQQIEDTPPRGRPLDIEEMAKLYIAAFNGRARHVEALMVIMLNTICRPGAARDLGPAQIDSRHGLVALNPPGRKQTRKRRPVVPLTSSLKASLIEIEKWEIEAAKRRHERGFKLANYVAYRGRATGNNAEAFRALVERAGFEDPKGMITPYSIRHTLARELRKARVPTEQIAVYLGHKAPAGGQHTLTYAPYDPEYLLDASAVVESYVTRLREEVMKQGVERSFL